MKGLAGIVAATMIVALSTGCAARQSALTPSVTPNQQQSEGERVGFETNSVAAAHIDHHSGARLANATGGLWVAYDAQNQSGQASAMLYFPFPYTKATKALTTGISNPGPIAANAEKHVVALADYNNNTVTIFSTANWSKTSVALTGNWTPQPSALVFDPQGNLFVLDRDNATILEYAPPYSGLPHAIKVPSGWQCYGLYQNCMTLDRHNNVLLADSGNDIVHVWLRSASGTYSGKPLEIKQLNNEQPESLALDNQGNLYVGESSQDVVNEYQAQTSASQPYKSSPGSTFSLSTLPFGSSGVDQIMVDSSGDVMTMRSGGDIIGDFAKHSGNALPIAWGAYNTTAMLMDSGGNLIVANQNSGAVQIFPRPYSAYPHAGQWNTTQIGPGNINAMAYEK